MGGRGARAPQTGDVTRARSDSRPPAPSVWAIVVAGGSGARFGGAKQFAVVAGRSVLDRSVDAMADVADGVVVVVPAEHASTWTTSVRCPTVVVAGGATRSASVRAGLAAVPDHAAIVLVHDAARPLVPAAVVSRVLDAVAAGAVAAVPAITVTDTIRHRSGGAVDRAGLVAVQTPQGFAASVLRAAHAVGIEATDDAAVVEAAGGTVEVVAGDPTNIKLTLPVDLAIAEAILTERERPRPDSPHSPGRP